MGHTGQFTAQWYTAHSTHHTAHRTQHDYHSTQSQRTAYSTMITAHSYGVHCITLHYLEQRGQRGVVRRVQDQPPHRGLSSADRSYHGKRQKEIERICRQRCGGAGRRGDNDVPIAVSKGRREARGQGGVDGLMVLWFGGWCFGVDGWWLVVS